MSEYVYIYSKKGQTPEYKTSGSAGLDIEASAYSLVQPGEIKLVPTDLIIKPPAGYFTMLCARSSLAIKKGLILSNGVGIIDADYCGPEDYISVALLNIKDQPVVVQAGERIAQLVFLPITQPLVVPIPSVDGHSRGGFGSTGGYEYTESNCKESNGKV